MFFPVPASDSTVFGRGTYAFNSSYNREDVNGVNVWFFMCLMYTGGLIVTFLTLFTRAGINPAIANIF